MRVRAASLLALAALAAQPAGAATPAPEGQRLDVVVVPSLDLAEQARAGAAVGLLVPDAGPRTSRERTLASLMRGEVVNSLRGELPAGEPVIALGRGGAGAGAAGTILLELPRGGDRANDRRYPVAVRAPGYSGLLTSEQTRLPGLVAIVDVVATARGEADALGSRPADDPVARLERLDERIDENGTARLPASLAAAVGLVLLALVRPRAAVLAFGTGLAVNLLLGVAGVSSPWLTVPALALGVVALGPLADRALRSATAAGAFLTGVVAAYLAALALDHAWVALSPLGPTQNARFYGISNLLETLLLPAALAAAALLARRLGWPGFLAVAALALVTVSGSRFGADGGGAVVLAAGFAVLAGLLARGPRERLVVLGGAAGALALVALDALAGPSTHVGRSLRGGPGELARDLGDRIGLSVERATSGWLVGLVVLAALAALAVLLARGSRGPLPVAFAAAIAVSLVVNDSPGDVAVGGLVGWVALEAFSRRGDPASRDYTVPTIVRGVNPR